MPNTAALRTTSTFADAERAVRFQLQPAVVDLGRMAAGSTYRVTVSLTNVGNVKSRWRALQPAPNPREGSATVLRVLYRPTPLAPGMRVRLELEVYAGTRPADLGAFKRTVRVDTETDVFRLPVVGSIVDPAELEPEVADAEVRTRRPWPPPAAGLDQATRAAGLSHARAALHHRHRRLRPPGAQASALRGPHGRGAGAAGSRGRGAAAAGARTPAPTGDSRRQVTERARSWRWGAEWLTAAAQRCPGRRVTCAAMGRP
jgi:hypothetical protein